MKLATKREIKEAKEWLDNLAAYPSFVTFRRGAFPIQVPVEQVMADYLKEKQNGKLSRKESKS